MEIEIELRWIHTTQIMYVKVLQSSTVISSHFTTTKANIFEINDIVWKIEIGKYIFLIYKFEQYLIFRVVLTAGYSTQLKLTSFKGSFAVPFYHRTSINTAWRHPYMVEFHNVTRKHFEITFFIRTMSECNT